MGFLESLIFITTLVLWVVMMFTIVEIGVVTDYLNEFKRKKDINRVIEYETRLVKAKKTFRIIVPILTIIVIILIILVSSL